MKIHFRSSVFLIPVLTLTLFGQGCFGSSTSAPTGPDGGVWKTSDSGTTWVNKKALVSGPKVTATGAAFSIVNMAFDPQDHNTIYLATAAHGMVFSLDGGDSWQQAKSQDEKKNVLTSGRVNAVAVDPKNKCIVYAASGNKIYKTETCGRDWNQIFFDPRTDKSFTQLIVDWFNPTILYAGTNDGDIFRSTDAGLSWQMSKRVDGISITSLGMDPRDSRLVYVGTQGDGIWKTVDGGTTWTQIKKQFGEEYTDARRVIQLVIDPVEANVIYNVSKYGIIKSLDGGETWKALNLTSPPGTVKINSLAVDPKNNKHLIYTGVSTLQFSSDGGVSWTPKKLPTTQAGSILLFDPIDSKVIYLGTVPPPSKK
ncbi:MAG: YCF48-related protein [Patescibacteria group bacterium]